MKVPVMSEEHSMESSMTKLNRESRLNRLAAVNVFLLLVGVSASAIFTAYRIPGERAPLLFSLGAIALMTFYGFCAAESRSSDWSMRRPIAAAASVAYLLLVIIFSFYMLQQEVPPMTSLLLTSFTSVYGVIVAFYFGSSAYVQGQRIKHQADERSGAA